MASHDEMDRLRATYRQARRDEIAAAFYGMPAGEDPARLEEALREFCLGSGHDLEGLTRFFQEVDAEVAEMIPK